MGARIIEDLKSDKPWNRMTYVERNRFHSAKLTQERKCLEECKKVRIKKNVDCHNGVKFKKGDIVFMKYSISDYGMCSYWVSFNEDMDYDKHMAARHLGIFAQNAVFNCIQRKHFDFLEN